ncbi:hypothetical protein ABMA27_009710 [Loxostege sticticalis]|uniref:Tetraspanin n=1 Tax=Loxostege sticticalis TaxID=481309 RepID=A0ABR3H6R8_LOXSC
MGCISNIAKFILFGVNALYSIVAIVLVASGALILYNQEDALAEIYLEGFVSLIMVIVCGCLLFLISLFGCCGVIAEKTCLLLLYVILMVLLICGNIYVIVEIRSLEFERIIEFGLNNEFHDPERDFFSGLEAMFNCCGTTGADSYENLNVTLPITCCPLPDFSEPQLCSKEDAYTGCIQVITSFLNSVVTILFYTVISIIVVEAVSVLLASYLIYDISKKKKKTKGERFFTATAWFFDFFVFHYDYYVDFLSAKGKCHTSLLAS